jgi:hypothetical protein
MESDEFILIDSRSAIKDREQFLSDRLEAELGGMGLSADFLSPVVQLTPRMPWVSGIGYVNFHSSFGVASWWVYGETNAAEYITSAAQALGPGPLELWFTNLQPALYLLIVEVDGFGPLGPGPSRLMLKSLTASHLIDITGPGRKYLATFIAHGQNPLPNLELVTMTPINLSYFAFYRATLVNVFS